MRWIVLALLLVASPVVAQPLRETHLYPGPDAPGGGSGCFLREYTAAHLAAHPQQQVTRIALGRDGYTPVEVEQVLILEVAFRSGDVAGALAFCRDDAPGMVCAVEGDGGRFSLEGRDEGALLMRPLGDGVTLEGQQDFFLLSPDTGDDRAFLIRPAYPADCP